jgi:threonylcarbamoyladenosine tRNA methylthiotransferase MtaB
MTCVRKDSRESETATHEVVAGSFPRRATLYTLGCRLNHAETMLIEGQLREAGFTIVPFGEPADVAIINTCTVTSEADAKSRKAVRQFLRKNPEGVTAVIGCSAQMHAKQLARLSGVDLIVGNEEKLNLLPYLLAGKRAEPLVLRDRLSRKDFSLPLIAAEVHSAHRANLKIQDGCDFMCSFCLIPFARGRARSRALPNLLEEARLRVDQGIREIVLTGVNIGTYEWEGKTLVHVVEALSRIPGLARLRISSIEPTTVPPILLEWMADPSHVLAPHLHLPLQSGSNRILQGMRRKYTREAYAAFATQAKQQIPNLCLGTDVLVGFPGETEEDFAETLDLLEKIRPAYAHVFKYSERPGTASVRLHPKVAIDIVQERSRRIRKFSADAYRAFQHQHIGKTVQVLFEEQKNGVWYGYTNNYVYVGVSSNERLKNELRAVQLEHIEGETVMGKLDGGRTLYRQ